MNDRLDRPMSTTTWFWYMVVNLLPVVGLVLMLVWAFGDGMGAQKRNYARASLLLNCIIFSVAFWFALRGIL